MVNRRALMATAVGMGALMLSGCVPWSTQGRVNRAAESVGGVESSELDVGRGGSFSPQITGRIHCAVGASELEDVLDAAWEQVVTALRSEERRVGKECRARWGPCQLKKREAVRGSRESSR